MKNNLAEIRKRKEKEWSMRITQQKVANSLRISRSHYNMIETGDRDPSLRLAKNIADFFEVSIDEIFFQENEDPVVSLDIGGHKKIGTQNGQCKNNDIISKLEEKRKMLNHHSVQAKEQVGNLHHERLLRISEEMDKLIINYYRNSKKNDKNQHRCDIVSKNQSSLYE
ncbi:MAG: helix-turn-helix domain-containing protein [Dehalobacterium sp.]